MAGRHGVPDNTRREHSKDQRSQRRQRVRRRDATQPWRLWLTVRIVLALIVVGAVGWSAWLLTRHRGDYWPWVAVVAGSLSLLLILLDVRSHLRERAKLRARIAARSQQTPPPPTPFPALLPPPASVPAPRAEQPTSRPATTRPPTEEKVPLPPPAAHATTTVALEPVALDLEPAAEPDLPPEYRGRHSHRA